MKKIDELPENVGRIVIAGHIHPDGDCVGSCLGLENCCSVIRPRAQVDIYLEKFSEDFGFLQGAGEVCHELPEREPYDVAFVLDCSDTERLGDAVKYFTSGEAPGSALIIILQTSAFRMRIISLSGCQLHL